MPLTEFTNLLKVFSKNPPTDIEQKELLSEVALVTLARATSADTHIHPIEVEAVQTALKHITGDDFSSSDIRLAANSALFDRAPLSKYLNRAARRLESEDRMLIAKGLMEVIKSDVRVSPYEADFFDMVTTALNLPPSKLVGLDGDQ